MTESVERETGSETTSCPNCGTTVAVVTRADGSTEPANCGSCYPAATSEQAAQQELPREVGTSPANQPDVVDTDVVDDTEETT